MTYPCIETTVDHTFDTGMEVRLWINEPDIPEEYGTAEEAKVTLNNEVDPFTSPREIIRQIIEKIPNINAVQLRLAGKGVVVYTVNFENDPHG